MRSKEEAHDYRYFPEPDLPPLVVAESAVAEVRAAMPELPDARRRRFVASFGLPEYDAVQLTQSRPAAEFFERTVAAGAPPKAASNWMMGELARALKERGQDLSAPPLAPERLAGLLALVDGGHDQRRDRQGRVREDVRHRTDGRGDRRRGRADADRRRGVRLRRSSTDVLAGNADAVAQYRAARRAARSGSSSAR